MSTATTTARDEIIASLDLGTQGLKCVVGLCGEEEQLDIIGTGIAPMKGMRAGLVHNRAELTATLKRVKDEAEMMAGCELKEVVASVSGQPVFSMNGHGAWRVRDGEVSGEDVARVLDVAQAHLLPADQEVLHCVPGLFRVDDQKNITRPMGIRGVRLEVEAHLIIGMGRAFEEISACARAVGLTIKSFVHAGVAAAETLLREEDKELGVALVDIGGAATEISVFRQRALVHTAVLPVGGDHVTGDLNEILQLPLVEAERLKQLSGCALTWMVGDHEQVELSGGGGRKPRQIRKAQVAGVIEARYEEILDLVMEDLEHAGLPVTGLSSVVLTGGATNIHGLVELSERVLGGNVSRGEPRGLRGLVDVVRNPKYATSTGLVLAGLRGHDTSHVSPKTPAAGPTFWNKILDWIR